MISVDDRIGLPVVTAAVVRGRGHFPMWDRPVETVDLICATVDSRRVAPQIA